MAEPGMYHCFNTQRSGGDGDDPDARCFECFGVPAEGYRAFVNRWLVSAEGVEACRWEGWGGERARAGRWAGGKEGGGGGKQ